MQFRSSGHNASCRYILNLQVEKLHKSHLGDESPPSSGEQSAVVLPKKKKRRAGPSSKEAPHSKDLFLSLDESLVKMGFYELFTIQISCLNHRLKNVHMTTYELLLALGIENQMLPNHI